MKRTKKVKKRGENKMSVVWGEGDAEPKNGVQEVRIKERIKRYEDDIIITRQVNNRTRFNPAEQNMSLSNIEIDVNEVDLGEEEVQNILDSVTEAEKIQLAMDDVVYVVGKNKHKEEKKIVGIAKELIGKLNGLGLLRSGYKDFLIKLVRDKPKNATALLRWIEECFVDKQIRDADLEILDDFRLSVLDEDVNGGMNGQAALSYMKLVRARRYNELVGGLEKQLSMNLDELERALSREALLEWVRRCLVGWSKVHKYKKLRAA